MEKDKVKSINIMSDKTDIFDTNNNYMIPLYQRGYEWKDKEISQLIEDINGIDINKKYYIGTLIVAKRKTSSNYEYEIIDGQQRLTTLFLILNFLKDNIRNSLKFDCRDKSNYTLEHIKDIINKTEVEKNKLEESLIDTNIEIAVNIINEKINEIIKLNKLDEFKRKLANVIIYQIEVPKNTDLNHYFEIMNTRGEQLSQTDILKANLMSYLKESKKEQLIFSTIWDACSDMDTYIQMGFNTKERGQLFGNSWNELKINNWDELKQLTMDNQENDKPVKINDIINSDFKIDRIDYQLDGNKQVKFKSVIDFPFFLIHVLKVYSMDTFKEPNIINEMIDDKKLLEIFYRTLDNINESNRETFVKNFIICLLKCRFLFDKYMIKRKYLNDEDDGQWSLQELNVSGKPKKPYYKNTIFTLKNERNNTNEKKNTNILMLQSLLRVSYTSPKVMYWITELLKWLINYNSIDNICEFDKVIEKYIINEVKKNFFDLENPFSRGVDTHHIVFNYLDYLLWKKKNINDFVFEFRNTVEHWYPQNPSIGTFERWKEKDELNYFGNLCLIQRTVNSKFSNMAPLAKKETFKDTISKGSLKLRLMSQDTMSQNNMDANTYWKNVGYRKHGKEMIKILKKACFKEK